GAHGEGLGDHGERTHGMLLYDSTLRVPLVVKAPGVAPTRRDETVSLVDIAPTILRAVGLAQPAEMKGRDLLQVRLKPDTTYGGGAYGGGANGGGGESRDIYAETEYPRAAGWSPLQALTDGRWMTIRAGTSAEVYDVEHDPGEL